MKWKFIEEKIKKDLILYPFEVLGLRTNSEKNIMREKTQVIKGIWIQHSPEHGICYETSLREESEQVVGFIPFEHPYEPRYLGSIQFVDVIKLGKPLLNLNSGLVQNHFYPLGGDPLLRPELVGKGLARKIELCVAGELIKHFPPDTQVLIPASSESHLVYCARVGIPPSQIITLREYFDILSKH